MDSVENLKIFIQNYAMTGDEEIYSFCDEQLYESYYRTKNRYAGRSLTQKFIAEIGGLDTKLLHSFVSKNGITNAEFRTKLIRMLYVLNVSPIADEITEKIWAEFPVNIFTRHGSPQLRVPPPAYDVDANISETVQKLKSDLSTSNTTVELMREEIAKKDIEINLAKSEKEKAEQKFLNQQVELNLAKIDLLNAKKDLVKSMEETELLQETITAMKKNTADKGSQTEASNRPPPPKRVPFNRFA